MPLALSLASTSNASSATPPTLHQMVPRNSYLHLGLKEGVLQLYQHAPVLTGFPSVNQMDELETEEVSDQDKNPEKKDSDGESTVDKKNDGNGQRTENDASDECTNSEVTYPVCWFEDEESGTPLRWQLFAGVLFDLLSTESRPLVESDSTPLPWRLIVHFTSYPVTLLSLNNDPSPSYDTKNRTSISSQKAIENNTTSVIEHLSHHFSNSLKQALFLQHDSNRISKDMNKSSHLLIWDSIVRNQFEVYKNVTTSCHFEGKSNDEMKHIPVRVLVDGRPAFAKPCVPLRRTESIESNGEDKVTINEVLSEWLPHLFENKKDAGNGELIQPRCKVLVQGIKVPLKSTVLDLWRALSHPDRFLYIIVISNR